MVLTKYYTCTALALYNKSMARTLSSTLADLESAIADEGNAWAASQGHAQNAHLAAVMGPSLIRNLRPSSEWSVSDSVAANQDLSREIWNAYAVSPHLQDAIEEHIAGMLRDIESGIADDIRAVDSTFYPTLNPVESREAMVARTDHTDKRDAITQKVTAVREEGEALISSRGVSGVSKSRQTVIDTHTEQTAVIERQASHLAFGDKAAEAIRTELATVKEGFAAGSDPRQFFTSSQYKTLSKERKTVAQEREHIELELQSYFDHFSQGASRSETAKPNREPLRLAPDLEEGKAGFKQIKLVDAFCLGRGNEFWAIIPDILRTGHDIDPVSFMHWRASACESDYPEALRQYRREQNRSFAQKLLSPTICSVRLRSKLLATHAHGANKIEVKAAEDDGVAIYWVICQLFHPISREYRRELEADLAKMHLQFRSGNPGPALELLRIKVQEALDVAARVKWDTVAIPLINTLEDRDAKFTNHLESFRDKPIDPDDSCVELDQLVSSVTEIIKSCNEAKKNWDERGARSAGSVSTDHQRRIAALESQLKVALKAKTLTPQALAGQATGTCMMPKCGRVIKPWKPGWKLCATCLHECVKGGKTVTLNDGTPWTPHQARCAIGEMKSKGAFKLSKKALKVKPKGKKTPKSALKANRKRNLENPETPGGEEGDVSDDDYEREVRFSSGTEQMFKELKANASTKSNKKQRNK